MCGFGKQPCGWFKIIFQTNDKIFTSEDLTSGQELGYFEMNSYQDKLRWCHNSQVYKKTSFKVVAVEVRAMTKRELVIP